MFSNMESSNLLSNGLIQFESNASGGLSVGKIQAYSLTGNLLSEIL